MARGVIRGTVKDIELLSEDFSVLTICPENVSRQELDEIYKVNRDRVDKDDSYKAYRDKIDQAYATTSNLFQKAEIKIPFYTEVSKRDLLGRRATLRFVVEDGGVDLALGDDRVDYQVVMSYADALGIEAAHGLKGTLLERLKD